MNNALLLSYAANTLSCLMSRTRAASSFLDARHAFAVQDMDAFAGDFWRFLFRGERRRLRLLDPEARPDGTFSPAEASGFDSHWHRYAALACVNERDCVQYSLQFNARSVSAEPDVEVEAMPDGGFAVRWNGSAEQKADVMHALVSFVLKYGFTLEPEEE